MVAESGFGDAGSIDIWYDFVLEDGRNVTIFTQTLDFYHDNEWEERNRERNRKFLEETILRTFKLDTGIKSVPFHCTSSTLW